MKERPEIISRPAEGNLGSCAGLGVVILSAAPLASRVEYALSKRVLNLCRQLNQTGLNVVAIAPDGILELPHGAHGSTERWTRNEPRCLAGLATLNGLMASLPIFASALTRIKRDDSGRRTVLLTQGIWISAEARVLAFLHPEIILHLDVPGIPHREIALSKPRFWRAKVACYRRLFGMEVQSSDVVSTINQAHADYIYGTYGKRAIVIPDILDRQWLETLMAIPPKKQADEVNVLYIGSISRSRLDLFFAAVSRLVGEGLVSVDIVGDGPDLAGYREEFGPLGVRFHGYVTKDEVVKRLADSDICYSDVWHEIGTPYKVIEYMAAGRAVVTHDTSSMRELVTTGVDGVLCDATEGAIGTAIRDLASAPRKRADLGGMARIRINTLHRQDRIQELATIYLNRVSMRTPITTDSPP